MLGYPLNAILCPSGDTTGSSHDPACDVSRFFAPVATSIDENARVAVDEVGIRVVDRGDDDRLAVGHPIPTDRADLPVEARADVPVAFGDLARRAAVRRHDEQVQEAGFGEADAILAIVQRVLVLAAPASSARPAAPPACRSARCVPSAPPC